MNIYIHRNFNIGNYGIIFCVFSFLLKKINIVSFNHLNKFSIKIILIKDVKFLINSYNNDFYLNKYSLLCSFYLYKIYVDKL